MLLTNFCINFGENLLTFQASEIFFDPDPKFTFGHLSAIFFLVRGNFKICQFQKIIWILVAWLRHCFNMFSPGFSISIWIDVSFYEFLFKYICKENIIFKRDNSRSTSIIYLVLTSSPIFLRHDQGWGMILTYDKHFTKYIFFFYFTKK